MVSESKYLKDKEDTAFHVSVSWIHFKSNFPNPALCTLGTKSVARIPLTNISCHMESNSAACLHPATSAYPSASESKIEDRGGENEFSGKVSNSPLCRT